MFRANPSPEGRGCREAAGEGYRTILLFMWYPALRATLSLRERDSPQSIFQESLSESVMA
jgi:hypothetical protein